MWMGVRQLFVFMLMDMTFALLSAGMAMGMVSLIMLVPVFVFY